MYNDYSGLVIVHLKGCFQECIGRYNTLAQVENIISSIPMGEIGNISSGRMSNYEFNRLTDAVCETLEKIIPEDIDPHNITDEDFTFMIKRLNSLLH